MLLIRKTDDISKSIKDFVSDMNLSKKPVFVFDIHKTALHRDGTPNDEIYEWIERLKSEDYNIFFLSYDGQEKRINENYKKIKKIYKDIPCIFMMKRKKHIVLKNLVKWISIDKRHKVKGTLIDDNPLNIKDMEKLGDEFEGIRY